jgi:hypothetical protein
MTRKGIFRNLRRSLLELKEWETKNSNEAKRHLMDTEWQLKFHAKERELQELEQKVCQINPNPQAGCKGGFGD